MNPSFLTKQTYPQFLKHIVPSVLTMVFLSFYTTIDGFFVSKYVGVQGLAAINIVVPITCVFWGIAIMLASGSIAIVGKKMGQKKQGEANSVFSFMTIALLIISIAITVGGMLFLQPILTMLGATASIMPYAIIYGGTTILAAMPMMFKLYFEYYARVDGAPKIALVMSSVGLILNVGLDYLFVAVLNFGIFGAALGTGLAVLASAIIGLVHFLGKGSKLKFTIPKNHFKEFVFSCYNGSSEMFTELSTGITTYLLNITALHFYGEGGIAAMSIIMYMFYFFIAAYFGITVAAAPIISYNLGAKNKEKIKQTLNYSFITLAWASIAIFLVSSFFGKAIVSMFTNDAEVFLIATQGIDIFNITFLVIGINVFMSGYFTAIGNGACSAIISIARSLVFVCVFIAILPRFLGAQGMWLAIPMAEMCSIILSVSLYLFKGRLKNIIK